MNTILTAAGRNRCHHTLRANERWRNAGQASIWYLNVNPTPGDISDESGRGHHPVWMGPLRPALWAGGTLPSAPPAAPTNLTVRSDFGVHRSDKH